MSLFSILQTEASMGWGGQEIRVLSEARVFAEEGHRVHLLCDAGSDIYRAAPDYGIERSAIPMKRKSLAGLKAMRGFLREWKPEVVNTHSSVDHWLTALARLGLRKPPAVVRTRHISAPVGRGFATRWLYNGGAERVMTTSRSIVADLSRDGFLPAQRVVSVPTGIDTGRFAPGDRVAARAALGLPGEGAVLAIVATLRSWKGHADLLDAFVRLGHGQARLLIVGDGPQEDNLRTKVAELGLAGRVIFAGRQSDVLPYLYAADVFVLPSYANEGVPQAMLQAMACALPVVACPVGGIPELGEGLEAVRFAEARNPESLASALDGLLAQPPGEAARNQLRQRVMDRYSKARMFLDARAVYAEAIAERRGRA
jgi:glycosyltransferase involved in cell wall biosynthesis